MTKKATKTKPAANAKPAAQKPAPVKEWTPPALKPYTITLMLDIDCAAHGTAHLLASDIARVANDAAMEFCDHMLKVYRVYTDVDAVKEWP